MRTGKPNVLETAGEEYVRYLFFRVRAEAFAKGDTLGYQKGITSPSKLGSIKLLYGDEADLFVPYATASERFTLDGEVKNQFGSTTQAEVNLLIQQAIENSTIERPLMPAMIASRTDQDSKDFLEYCGVPYLELGRQILPASLKNRIIELFTPEIANERFQFVAKRPLRTRPDRNSTIDERSQRDIALISNPEWVLGNRSRWLAMAEKVNRGSGPCAERRTDY